MLSFLKKVTIGLVGLGLVMASQPALAASKNFTVRGTTSYQLLSSSDQPVEPFVFVETSSGASTVRRAKRTDAPTTELFAVAASGSDALANTSLTDATTTFPKGRDLDITLGDWLAAQGSIKLTCRFHGDSVKATLSSKFTHLVPKGTYTLWGIHQTGGLSANSFDNLIPLGDPADKDNVIKASSSGRGSHTIKLNFCPGGFSSDDLKVLLFYNFDGQTHGAEPSSRPFGIVGGFQLSKILG